VAGLVPQQVADPHRCTSMCSAVSRRYCRVQAVVQIDAPGVPPSSTPQQADVEKLTLVS
jgi:hypothetical protein